MARISRQVMFMGIARLASQRSTCFRLNVGALVVQKNNPIALGYNGQEPGASHCPGNSCPGIIPGRCGTLHAEMNALTKASSLIRYDAPQAKVDLYCTDSPCPSCTEFILNTTPLVIERLFYETPYRDITHLSRLKDYCEIYRITPAGYIVDHFTREVVDMP
jgi:dCMP deaminase